MDLSFYFIKLKRLIIVIVMNHNRNKDNSVVTIIIMF